MASLLRDVELLAHARRSRPLANPDVRPALERLTPRTEASAALRAFAAVDQALVALERNAGVKTWPTGWCCSYDRCRTAVPARRR